MQTQTLLIGIGIIAIVGAVLYRAYMRIKPDLDKALEDGSLSMGEVIGMADDLIESAKEVETLVESLPPISQLKKMKKADLIALAEKNGVDTQQGAATKATLIANLLDME
jgi:hypothetical protein